jgi:hypothetical protein
MRRLPTSLLSAALLGTIAACGSDATGPANNQTAFTVQEATTVASAIFSEISRALSTSGFALDVAPTTSRAAAARSMVPVTGSSNVNAACTNGGTITGKYTYSEDFANDGTGTASGSFSVAMTGCKVSTGTRVIAVDGQLTYTFGMTFAKNVALDTFNWRGTGSFTWSGGNCAIDYTVNYTGSATGKSTITGTFCGVNLNQTL